MAHLLQVGAGSGGMPVLDLVCRDATFTSLTLIEPDIYKSHNVVRHLFPPSDVGRAKADLAREWLLQRRPELSIEILKVDVCDPAYGEAIHAAAARADVGVCAADGEAAKFQFNRLMLHHAKPWTLGEVLAGGIGGFVHAFAPGGPCYGCAASFLQRSVATDASRPPDYSQPGGPVAEAAIPASKTSIAIIAGLHAQFTLQLVNEGRAWDPGFTSLLMTLQKVPGVFAEAYRTLRFRVARSPECLECRDHGPEVSTADLDQELGEALKRLGDV